MFYRYQLSTILLLSAMLATMAPAPNVLAATDDHPISTSASSNSPIITDTGPVVLASIRPLALLAEGVVGKYGSVELLLKNNASPHHYALSVHERQKILSADIILWVGSALEQFLTKPLAQRGEGVITGMSLDGMHWPALLVDHHAHDHGHDHGDQDPHIWLDPMNNIVMIDALVVSLAQRFPQYQSQYQANGEQLKTELLRLDQVIQQESTTDSGTSIIAPFIVAHPAYGHFVERYQLPQLDYVALTPERKAGAKQLYRLRNMPNLQCIFVDYGWSNKSVSRLASDVGVPLFSLDPLGVEVPDDGQAPTIVNLLERLWRDFKRCQPK